MEDAKGSLILGTLLAVVGAYGIAAGPAANKLTHLVGPYLMLPLGLVVLVRGYVVLARLGDRPWLEKSVLGVAYPAVTFSVLLLWHQFGAAFRGDEDDLSLLAMGVGGALLAGGYLLLKAVERKGRSEAARGNGRRSDSTR